MNKAFSIICEGLQKEIQGAYEQTPTIEEAEKLAARFLDAQLMVASELRTVDLDARMKKSGLKAVKAAVYLEEATKSEKKPSDTFLQAIVDRNDLVAGEQESFDKAEVNRDALQNYLQIFREAHIYFRSLSKGRFE